MTATMLASPAAPKLPDWSITWRGHSWSDSEITVEHLAALAVISGDDSFGALMLDPVVIRDYPGQGYMRLVFMLSALAVVEACKGLEGDEAAAMSAWTLEEIQRSTADAVLGSIRFG